MHRFVIEFLARQKTVAADDAVHMHAGFDPFPLNHRINGVGRRGDDVAAANRLFSRCDRTTSMPVSWLNSLAKRSRFSLVGL